MPPFFKISGPLNCSFADVLNDGGYFHWQRFVFVIAWKGIDTNTVPSNVSY